MSNCIELILEHVKLVQQGKDKEAYELLKKIWEFSNDKGNSKEINKTQKVPEVPKEKPKEVKRERKISDLTKIKGIGKKTTEDLESIYGSYDKLIQSLKEGKDVPLRDNINKILREELL